MPEIEAEFHVWLVTIISIFLSSLFSVLINISPNEIQETGNETLRNLMTCTGANDKAKTHTFVWTV